MATRCNIKVTDGRDVYYIYRHWDGYPGETGAHVFEVADKLKDVKDWNRGISAVNMFFRYMREDYEGNPKSHYELTSETHGDIEHFYHIWFKHGGGVVLEYAGGYGPDLEFEAKPLDLEEFRLLVNAERTTMNDNLRLLKNTEPAYKDFEPYEMI